MGGNVGDHVDVANHAGVVDEEGVATRVLGVLLVDGSGHLVGAADSTVDVAEQLVVEALRLGEREVLLWSVEGGAEDDAVGLGELGGAVTQPLALDRSTGRRRFGIPPQQHPVATKVGKADLDAMLVRQAEIRSGHSGSEHLLTLERHQNAGRPPQRL